MKKLLLFLLISTITRTYALAEGVSVIEPGNGELIIQTDLAEYAEPVGQKLSINDIAATDFHSKFKTTRHGTDSHFMSGRGFWYRFPIQKQISGQVVLEVHNVTIDETECYVVNKEGTIVTLPPANWQIPINQRPVNTYRNVFLIPVDSGKSVEVFIRLKKDVGTLRTYFSAWSLEAFNEDIKKQLITIGFLSGVFLFIIILSALLFFSTADFKYLFYGLYVLSIMLWRFSTEGYFLHFLTDHLPAYSNPSYGNLWQIGAALFYVLFLKSFVLQKEKSPKWHFSLANLNIAIVSLFFVFFLFLGLHSFCSKIIGQLYFFAIGLSIFNGLFFSVSGIKRGETNAYIYFFSNLIFLLYSLVLVTANAGFLPNVVSFRFSIMWALLAEISLLCMGLGYDFRRQLLERKDLLLQVSEQQRIALEANNKWQQQTIKTIQAENILKSEKERISRDLHDSIGSDLSNIIYSLDYIANKLKNNAELKEVEQLQSFSRQTMDQLRSAIWVLNQEQVSIDDFCHKLHSYISKHLHNFPALRYQIDLAHNIHHYILPTTHALYLYRIVQEALNNTIKYAGASLFQISFAKNDTEKLKVTISDNGSGFSREDIGRGESYGLDNMASRIASLHGEFSISSSLGKGTTIMIFIPMTN